MAGFVLDASVALSAVLPGEPAALDARSILAMMPADRAFVPTHWHLEVGNTVLVHTRRRRLLPADAERTIEALRSLPVAVDAETGSQALDTTFQLAEKHGLTLYDAAYLELALRLNLPLATFDKALCRAAEAEHVALANPPA